MVKDNLLYTETHEWIEVIGDEAVIGITDYAQHELGDIVYVELPEVGDDLERGEGFGSIEAVKAVEDILSPITGEVIAINEDLEDTPEAINNDAFGDGWIMKVKLTDMDELEDLLNAEKYKKLINS
ncbi:MAG: glycine cleavage system protein GcvH [Candidatus Cloacimonetes bacterium]|jgi:glycine cleavage system H protein|nr:glycine cleavage system protein GcvH [Candidatus Cloacimonadota bacterium]MBT4331797.1 glycine cleavage system protein GcvH [Candidatus Cloacimonadota bacterium]MBT4575914.1 glycine cleavage system protein GcvH [Candidatus Cloacimonadota bacterium]